LPQANKTWYVSDFFGAREGIAVKTVRARECNIASIPAFSRLVIVALVTSVVFVAPSIAFATTTTAWHDGAFQENTADVVGESDVILGAPNAATSEFLPLGNGSLGVAAWAQNGFTAQLNRDDTFPDRKSPGQLNIPGLEQMTTASDFSGKLDLYNGVLDESGGGMTLKAWVPSGKDELIVDVTGADPSDLQTATIGLWSGRSPTAAASDGIGTLAETWTDNTEAGNSDDTFGSLAAITAGGQDVSASVVNSKEVEVSFYPNSDGSYRIVVAAPSWTGGDAESTASTLIGSDATTSESTLLSDQSTWWNDYWSNSDLMQITSSDGSGEYMENLRTLYLYFEAATMRGDYPGSQAGLADLFSFSQDTMLWDPAAYWLYDLRTQISENMSSGNFALNLPIFNLYLNNLSNLESWTDSEMGGTSGICVPETMRFNGNGYYENPGLTNASCSENDPGQGDPDTGEPLYNALNITSGAELAMDIWQQYQDTGNTEFLSTYYPLMKQAAAFLLDYQTPDGNGDLSAYANAHESQWDVLDPTDDIAAETALFPATIEAADTLGVDSSLVTSLTTAESEIPPYPRVSETDLSGSLVPASDDADDNDAIADSYQPSAALHNEENIGLEPVYPFGVIGDDSTLTALASRTYDYRPNGPTTADWSMDAIDAARLDMASQVKSDLLTNTEDTQMFISGLADVVGHTSSQPYLEQSSGVSYALDQALVQDYDGLLRIAPAWPSGWNVSGTVAIQGNAKVDVQVESGTIETVAIEAGSNQSIDIRNPWPGEDVEVINGSTNAAVVSPTTASTFTIPVSAGSSYLVEPTTNLTTALSYAEITGSVPTTDRHLAGVQIGLDSASSLASSFNNVGITADSSTNVGNYDGNGSSFSETALTNAGAAPGATITSGGLTYTWPNVSAGTADNTIANGQAITINQAGSELGFLISSANGSTGQIAPGSITYTDGTTQQYTLAQPSDWFSTTAPSGGAVAVTSTYLNIEGNSQDTHSASVFSETVPVDPTKTVAFITLPSIETLSSSNQPWHIFAVTVGTPASATLAESFNDVGITSDSSTNVGNYDGNGSSYSETALTDAGASPGATIASGGLTYTWPNVSAGTDDNTVADGQDVAIGETGSELGFLVSGSYGPVSGSGVITYSDGSTQNYTLSGPDWWSTTPPTGGAVAVNASYLNIQGNSSYTHTTDVFSEEISINPDKTVASITLPDIGTLASGTPALHIFALTVGSPNLAAAFDNIGITSDLSTNVGNYDGNGSSFSETALTNAGASPGATITSGGLTYTWPSVSAGTADNVTADGQDITIGASGSDLGFLVSGSYGPVSGAGVITYTDGTTQNYTLSGPDWWSTTPPTGGAVAVSTSYLNIQGNSSYTHTTDVFSEQISINAAKTVASVTLPDVGTLASGTPTLHVFAVTVH
jgi:hypothetical protein